MKTTLIKSLSTIVFLFLIGITNLAAQWTFDFNFNDGVPGEQVTEFSDASGHTYYNTDVVYDGTQSAQLNIQQGADGWGLWGGRKQFPSDLGEGDEVWVRVRTFFPTTFNIVADPFLKFLRFWVREDNNDHLGYVDLYILNDGSYRYQNELSTTRRLRFRTLRSTSTDYVVGETIVGSVSGAMALVRAIIPAPEASSVQSDRVVFDYTNGLTFDRWEDIEGQTSGTIWELNRVESNSVTNFGSQHPIQKGVWETYVYRVKFSASNPLVQVYKHIGGSGFDANNKPIGGALELLFESTTDYTLKKSTDKASAFLLFTYWNGSNGAPQTQNMYVDDLWISTSPPPELSGVAPTQYTLTTNTTGNGTVSGAGTYDNGTVVSLTATPDEGWKFDGWSGGLSINTSPTEITMVSDKTVTATFIEDPIGLSIFLNTPPPYAQLSDFGNANSACGSGSGNEYWVDINNINADDAGLGTKSEPWETFKHASNIAQAGDIINVMPGIYIDTEIQNSNSMWRAFNPANSGEEGNPIIFRSVIPHQAILKSSAPDIDKAYRDKALAFWSKNDIIYDGFKTIGMVHFNSSQRISFINGEITVGSVAWNDPGLFWGIAIERSDNCVIKNNKVHELTIAIKGGNKFIKSNQAGIMVFGGGNDFTSNNLIANNYVDAGNNTFSAIANKGGNIKHNLWQNNFVKNAEVGFLTIGSTDRTKKVYDSYYVNNIIVDTKVGLAFENGTLDTYVVNNTFVRNQYAIRFIAFNSTGTVLINNAIFDTQSYISAHGYWGIPGLELPDMFEVANFNQFDQLDYWVVRESPSNILISSMEALNDLGLDQNSIVAPLNFITPTGTKPENFKRTAYPQNGIGGEYATTIGAYTSNDDIVGTFTATPCTPTTQYTLTTSTAGNGNIDRSPAGGIYNDGTVVTLTATPDTGWRFDGWSGDLSGNNNPETITMNANKTVTATFSQTPPTQYTLTVNKTGNGSVSPAGDTYDNGTVVSLTATPDDGWRFTSWSGDLTGTTNPESITMGGNKTVTATFSEIPTTQYALAVNKAGNGIVDLSPTGGAYDSGTVVTLTATPDDGWRFTGWSGDLTGTTNPETITMDGDKTVTATFSETPPTQYTLITNVMGNGSVDPTGGTYDSGTVVTLTATPDDGWRFTGWSGDLGESTNPGTITMDGDKTVTATFSEEDPTTISITPNPTSGVLTVNTGDGVLLYAVIYNELGQKIKETTTTSEMDISNMASGVYFVKVVLQSGKAVTKKIIKK